MDKKNRHNKMFPGRYNEVLVCLFLVMATLSVYWQTRNYEFVNFDDTLYVTGNQYVQKGLTFKNIIWSFTKATESTNYWAPLVWISFLLDYECYGTDAGGYHLTNLFLHIANTLLLFLIFRQITGYLWRSAMVAALFAIHPLHVESVAWVTERKDVLSTFFWMLTIWAYGRYARKPELKKYIILLLLFIMGIMSKPMVVTLPFVLLLFDYWPLKRISQWTPSLCFSLILEKIPLFIMALIASIATFITQKAEGTVPSLDVFPLSVRIENVFVSYVSYIKKMVWPYPLAPLYPHPGDLPLWQAAGAFLLIIVITIMAIMRGKHSPWFAVGWLWFIGTLVPVIGFVVIGPHAMADRYTYVPLIGLFIIAAWSISECTEQHITKLFLPFIAISILSILMILSFFQVQYWKNNLTLFEHTAKVTSDNYLIHNNLGNALAKHGRLGDAVKHFKEALRVKPDYGNAHYNLGIVLEKQGQVNSAINHYKEALRIKPGSAQTHNNMGIALKKQGDFDKAIKHYKEAIRIDPDFKEVHYNMGNALRKQGRLNEAVKQYKKILRFDPNLIEAHYNLANTLLKQGRVDDAITHYKEALRINPDSKNAHNNIGMALRIKGSLNEAIGHFRKAINIDPNYSNAQNNLKEALTIQKLKK